MFDRKSRIIKDGTTLSFDYVPQFLYGRESQMQELERMFSPLAFDGRACSAYLYGGVGAGKTVTAKRFCMDMAAYFYENNRRMDYAYVNCRLKGTEYAVLLELIRKFDPGFPDRGFAADEILTMVKRNLEREKIPFVVILDEVDVILKANGKNLVYQLSRFSEDLKNGSLSLILVSQYPLATMIDEASMSTFRRANLISFAKYGTEELKKIVVYRAELALEEGALPGDSLNLLATLSEEWGDARFALEVLERAAHVAEKLGKSEIDLDSVRTASSSIYSDASENKLRSLDQNRKIVLLSIARAIKSSPTISITKCEKTYSVVCEEYRVPAKKHTQFYTYVQDMERQGLLRTEVRREPDGGRVTHIAIDNIPPKELANKLEYLLDCVNNGEQDLE